MNKSCWMWNSATGKALSVCVCGRETEKRVSHILCNNQDCIPRQLSRGSLRNVPGCRSNKLWSSHPLLSLQPPRTTWEISSYCPTVYHLQGWYKYIRCFNAQLGSRFITYQLFMIQLMLAGRREGQDQTSVPQDHPCTELILKTLQVPRALQASTLATQPEEDNWNPFPSNVIFLSADHSSPESGERGAGHNYFFEMEVIPIQFRSLSLIRLLLQSQTEH